ncbi:unnamed protein product [Closterium sp. NIES-54]
MPQRAGPYCWPRNLLLPLLLRGLLQGEGLLLLLPLGQVPRRCSTHRGRQTRRWLTSPVVASTSCSSGVTGRCTRGLSRPCTPATTSRHATPATSAGNASTAAAACTLTPLLPPLPRERDEVVTAAAVTSVVAVAREAVKVGS